MQKPAIPETILQHATKFKN